MAVPERIVERRREATHLKAVRREGSGWRHQGGRKRKTRYNEKSPWAPRLKPTAGPVRGLCGPELPLTGRGGGSMRSPAGTRNSGKM